MEPYNPNKRYLGPQNHWLNKYIPEHPKNAPERMMDDWNEAAYEHDVDFDGDDYAGWFGWIKKWINRKKVREEISKANQKFRDKLILSVERHKHLMTVDTRVRSFAYANIVYQAVEGFGWAFYKVGERKDA